jgi:hypothetical protein
MSRHRATVSAYVTLILFVTVFSLALPAGAQAQQFAYRNTFESAPGPEWSNGSRSVASGRGFLGPFGNGQSTTLTFTVPQSGMVTVSFDLFVLGSWNGNAGTDNDRWLLLIDGSQYVNATFSNSASYTQTYPNNVGSVVHPARTGSFESNTLKYGVLDAGSDDVYRIARTFSASAGTHVVTFYGTGSLWGLDNVEVRVGAPRDLMSWGLNSYGQLGDGTTLNRLSPVHTPDVGLVRRVVSGDGHTAAIRASDNAVLTWGSNTFGETGPGYGVGVTLLSPRVVVDSAGTMIAAADVAAAFHHTLILGTDGTLYAMGQNESGELGTRTPGYQPYPVPVRSQSDNSPLSGVLSFATGVNHGLAATNDGLVRAWGDNTFGQLGDGNVASDGFRTLATLSGVTAVAAGD